MAANPLVFQNGNRISGKLDVVNNTYILNMVYVIELKYFDGSTNGWFGVEKSTYPSNEKNSI